MQFWRQNLWAMRQSSKELTNWLTASHSRCTNTPQGDCLSAISSSSRLKWHSRLVDCEKVFLGNFTSKILDFESFLIINFKRNSLKFEFNDDTINLLALKLSCISYWFKYFADFINLGRSLGYGTGLSVALSSEGTACFSLVAFGINVHRNSSLFPFFPLPLPPTPAHLIFTIFHLHYCLFMTPFHLLTPRFLQVDWRLFRIALMYNFLKFEHFKSRN